MESRLGLRERLELSRLRTNDPPNIPQTSNTQDAIKFQEKKLQEMALDDDNNENDDDEESMNEEPDIDEDGNDEENDPDDDDDDDTAPESQGPSMKILHSRYPNRSPIVCFEYPLDLNVTRRYPQDAIVEEVDPNIYVVNFKSYWERNCIKNAFYRAGLVRVTKGNKWTAAWIKHMPRTNFSSLLPHQRVNHFPDPWVIGRKDRLLKTLTAMKRKHGAAYSFIPEGYLLPTQRDAFQRQLDRDQDNSLWIIKPPASACGRGIKVIQASQVDSIKKTKKLVVQRYLATPYLIDGYKFDLRIYVLVTNFDPLRIYLFEEGLARFCTVKYATNASQLKNRLAHLTNFSVNKKNTTFKASSTEKDTDGSKWSLTALMKYLEENHGAPDTAVLRGKMKDIICKTIIAAEGHITRLTQSFVKHRNVCYELFGFDMMIDADMEPWLIEVNVSPSLMGSSPLDKRIKGLLMSDIFHLVGHPVRESSRQLSTKSLSTPKKTKGISRKLYDIIHDPKIALDTSHLALFSQDDWNIIYSMEDEMDRIGHFERIYPQEDKMNEYASFFISQRYGNRLCEKWFIYIKKQNKKNIKNKGKSPLKIKQPNETFINKIKKYSL